MNDYLSSAFPQLGERLRKARLAELPTPVSTGVIDLPAGKRTVAVKRDDLSNAHYGGNKIRKLEYILQRALDRKAERVATFGAAGSNHALATAILAHDLGLDCTCFLAHQKITSKVPLALNMHRLIGTEIVRFGGSIDRLALFREYLQHRHTWVVPLGGSSWLGTVGFVNAGLELVAQIENGDIPCPERIYIANGTMGSTAGLLLGLAAVNAPIDVHAVIVVDPRFGSPAKLDRLLRKTAMMLNRLDPAFDRNMYKRVRLVWRGGFLGGGYAAFDERMIDALDVAHTGLGLSLETTYTGKALAAMLHDLQQPCYDGELFLFWNTYNSRELPVTADKPATLDNIPNEFMRYFEKPENHDG